MERQDGWDRDLFPCLYTVLKKAGHPPHEEVEEAYCAAIGPEVEEVPVYLQGIRDFVRSAFVEKGLPLNHFWYVYEGIKRSHQVEERFGILLEALSVSPRVRLGSSQEMSPDVCNQLRGMVVSVLLGSLREDFGDDVMRHLTLESFEEINISLTPDPDGSIVGHCHFVISSPALPDGRLEDGMGLQMMLTKGQE